LKQKEAEAKALKEAEKKAEKARDGKFRFEQLSSFVYVIRILSLIFCRLRIHFLAEKVKELGEKEKSAQADVKKAAEKESAAKAAEEKAAAQKEKAEEKARADEAKAREAEEKAKVRWIVKLLCCLYCSSFLSNLLTHFFSGHGSCCEEG
jgi:cytoskeletal protein RodZ